MWRLLDEVRRFFFLRGGGGTCGTSIFMTGGHYFSEYGLGGSAKPTTLVWEVASEVFAGSF
jgi:hypothetical protein